MSSEQAPVMAGSLTDWPIKLVLHLGGFAAVACNRDGCHAEFVRVHLAQLDPFNPVETTFGAGLALVEAHEPFCPTPPPIKPATCGALWTVHACLRKPGHDSDGGNGGHRCSCGEQPAAGHRIRHPKP